MFFFFYQRLIDLRNHRVCADFDRVAACVINITYLISNTFPTSIGLHKDNSRHNNSEFCRFRCIHMLKCTVITVTTNSDKIGKAN